MWPSLRTNLIGRTKPMFISPSGISQTTTVQKLSCSRWRRAPFGLFLSAAVVSVPPDSSPLRTTIEVLRLSPPILISCEQPPPPYENRHHCCILSAVSFSRRAGSRLVRFPFSTQGSFVWREERGSALQHKPTGTRPRLETRAASGQDRYYL